MHYRCLLFYVITPMLLFGSNVAIDKSASYTREVKPQIFLAYRNPDGSGLDEKKLEEAFGDKLDEMFCAINLEIPLYGKKLPLSMPLLSSSPLTPSLKEAQLWCFEKTKKLVDCLILGYLCSPINMMKGDPEGRYLSLVNRTGQDTQLTPGFALIKKISSAFRQLKVVYVVDDKKAVEKIEQQAVDYLNIVKLMIAHDFDVYRSTQNYCLDKNSGRSPARRLYESRKKKSARPIDYLKAWCENTGEKYYSEKSSAIKKAMIELYELAARSLSTIARHFSVSRQALVPRGEFKVTEVYADCVVVRESE